MARAGDNGELTKRGKGWLQGSEERNEQLANYLSALFAPISRDGKSAIDKAMKRYRTLEGTMTASVSELCEIEGTIFTCFIKLLAYVTSRRVTDKFNDGKKPLESVEIPRYLKALFLGVAVETAYLLTFDSAGRFIDATVIGEGTVNSTDVLPRRALEAALERSAKSVILAHNHPFGKPDASDDDVRLTNVMNKVFAACEVRLIGHYIVAGQRCNALIVRSE
jgi:DNA repair protein RadC